jgi:hypothetical protein
MTRTVSTTTIQEIFTGRYTSTRCSFAHLFGREVWHCAADRDREHAVRGATLAFRRYLPRVHAASPRLRWAISPGCVFYGRDSILNHGCCSSARDVWGFAGLGVGGRTARVVGSGAWIDGEILTKETYALHCVALLLAIRRFFVWEKISPSAAAAHRTGRWTMRDIDHAHCCLSGVDFLFLHRRAFLDWSSPGGARAHVHKVDAYRHGGRERPRENWHYFLELIARYEWPALLGSVRSPGWHQGQIAASRGISRSTAVAR